MGVLAVLARGASAPDFGQLRQTGAAHNEE